MNRVGMWVALSALGLASSLQSCSCGETPPGAGPGNNNQGPADASTANPTPDGGQPGTDRFTSLSIDPPSARLTTDGTTAAEQTFTVTAQKEDGTTEDVTTRASITLTPTDLGTITQNRFSGTVGGRGTVVAQLGILEATAELTVIFERTVRIPPVEGNPIPENPGPIFESGPDDPDRNPVVVYPNDEVILPKNLGSVEIHFRPANATNLFEVRLESPVTRLFLYTRCNPLGGGCYVNVNGTLWTDLARDNGGRDPVNITVRGTNDAGEGVGTSDAVRLRFSPENVAGGLYYWTTTDESIMRVEFGSDEPPEKFFPFQGTVCHGCHALSRNGERMTVSRNGQHDGRVSLVDVGGRTVLAGPNDDFREQFQTWNPTSDRFAGVYGDRNIPDAEGYGDAEPDTHIRIRDGDTGDLIEAIDIGNEVTHPDWSPRGDRILFTKVTRHQTSQRPGRGGIAYIESLPGGGWSPARDLVEPEDGRNRYYPAYAPSAEFLVYNESICPDGEIYSNACDADADQVAKLWALLPDGGEPISLDRVNSPGVADEGAVDLSNTFPKWAPFVDAQSADGTGRLMWFTFSSRRQYGLRAPPGNGQLLWMVAVDPDEILAGRDGSFTPFALPFQDLTTSNHIAQWTVRIVPPDPPDAGPGDPNDPDGSVDPNDPNNRIDAGMCVELGGPCTPGESECCAGGFCSSIGPDVFVCRPDV